LIQLYFFSAGVPRHLRESHVEERKRQRQPDLSAYGPASAAAEFEPKVSHGNRADFGEVSNVVVIINSTSCIIYIGNGDWDVLNLFWCYYLFGCRVMPTKSIRPMQKMRSQVKSKKLLVIVHGKR
jgi:hypothetical protein